MGYPLPGATVRAECVAQNAVGVFKTNERGEARIPVEPGRWSIQVELSGFHAAHYDFDVRPDSRCCLRFELDLENSLAVTVS